MDIITQARPEIPVPRLEDCVMKNLFRVLVTLLLLGGWALAAAALHVIYTGGRLTVIPKDRLDITDTYVDPRTWTLNDVAEHPAVVSRLIATGKADVLKHVADTASSDDLVTQLRHAIERGGPDPKKKTAPSTRPVTARL
jgi:hypothetical protein